MVGQTATGYKPGRETREGTLRIQKVDSTWAMAIFNFLGQGLAARRAARGTAAATLGAFDLKLTVDDPTAYDYESWQLENCQIWQMPIGFSITDDIIQQEIPMTWEAETPIHVFQVNPVTGAVVNVTPASTI